MSRTVDVHFRMQVFTVRTVVAFVVWLELKVLAARTSRLLADGYATRCFS